MKLEKAIGILNHPPFYPSTPSDKDFAAAIKLGIEAMERLLSNRMGYINWPTSLLPGETNEEERGYKMKLGKAIEILDTLLNDYNEEPYPDEIDALKLGIEAMKRIKSGRNPERQYVCYQLPGETLD